MTRLTALVLVLLCAAPLSASAIVIRHDRDDAAYRELAQDFPMVCRVGGGMGTLVAPGWVLTAAHVADALPDGRGTVRWGEREVKVAEVFLHPDYGVQGKHRDLALLKLVVPVRDIGPAVLQRTADELGRTVIFVGDGQTGDGRTGPAAGERVPRAARNTVATVEPGWLTFSFDAPPAGDDLEGISGPGDSGGPALVPTGGGRWSVIGVSAWNDGGPLCTYGTIEHYSRVSDEADWLDGVMAGRIAAVTAPRVMKFSGDGEGQSTVSRADPEALTVSPDQEARVTATALRLAAVLNAGKEPAFRAMFNQRCLAADPRLVASMTNFMAGSRGVHGDIVSMHPVGQEAMAIPESAFPMIPVVFHMADGMPGYFGLALDDAGLIDNFSLFVMEKICAEGKDCTKTMPLGG